MLLIRLGYTIYREDTRPELSTFKIKSLLRIIVPYSLALLGIDINLIRVNILKGLGILWGWGKSMWTISLP